MKKENPQTNAPYSAPVISTSNPKDWYVFFTFFHAGKVYERKIRKGINRFSDLKERKKEAEGLCVATLQKLKEGWNPIVDPEFKARNIVSAGELACMSFNEAMDFALEKKTPDLAKKSVQDYRNVLNIVKEHARKIGVGYLQINKVTRLHVLNLLETITEARELSNHRFNIYLGVVRSMFTTLEIWTVCEYNPATKIAIKPVAESNYFATYTEEEKFQISEHLAAKHYRLFSFMQVIYQTGIRPKELLSLRVGDVDLLRRVITLTPDLKKETTKTKFIRPLPISNSLLPVFKEMYLDQFPKDFYVFGSPFEPGEGNRGAGSQRWGKKNKAGMGFKTGRTGAMRLDYLTPSPFQASRDTVGRLWKNLVKDPETGLGINKCLYAAKHTGADDKILAGIDLDTLRNLYGHRSKQMTERYARQIRELYNSNIIANAPAFIQPKKPAKIRKIA